MTSDVNPEDTVNGSTESFHKEVLHDDMIDDINALLREEAELEAAEHEIRWDRYIEHYVD